MLLPSCGCHLVGNVENQKILQIFVGTHVTQLETGAVSSHCIQKLSWVKYFFLKNATYMTSMYTLYSVRELLLDAISV